MSSGETHGIWGGTTPEDRTRARRQEAARRRQPPAGPGPSRQDPRLLTRPASHAICRARGTATAASFLLHGHEKLGKRADGCTKVILHPAA